MRAYYWGNLYMSSIQQGIQSLHCTGELFIKYHPQGSFTVEAVKASADLYDWAENHKTVIVLNAGEMKALEKVRKLFDDPENPYAWASWNESEESLAGALTSVGVILPERIYIGAREMKKFWRNWNNKRNLTPWEIKVCELINTTYMAR